MAIATPVSVCGWYCHRCPGAAQDCVGCRAGGGDESCKALRCAKEREIVACPLCGDYPCDNISDMLKNFPLLAQLGNRMKEIGLEAWVKEQEALKNEPYVFEEK